MTVDNRSQWGHPPIHLCWTSCKNVVIKFARQMLRRDRRGPHPRPNSIYHLLHVRDLLYDSLKAKLIFARIIIQVRRVQASIQESLGHTIHQYGGHSDDGRSDEKEDAPRLIFSLVFLHHVARQLFTVSQAAMKFYKLPTGGGQGKKSSWRRWWCWPPINNTALEMREFIDLIVKDINWRFNIVIT